MSPNLSGSLEKPTREGVNQLTGHIVYVMPYAVAYFWGSRGKFTPAVPLVVVVVSWIYAASRGAWVAVLVGLVVMALVLGKSLGSRKLLALVLLLTIVGGASLWVLGGFIPAKYLDSVSRAQYLYDPEGAPEVRGYQDRWDPLMSGLMCCAVRSPLVGVGLANTQAYSGLPHNEYVRILGDLGLAGLLLFALILFAVF